LATVLKRENKVIAKVSTKSFGYLCAICLSASIASLARATDYYVSPSGNDSKSGTSPANAWKTINKVNFTEFEPGDTIHFEGGSTFSGGLEFYAHNSGTAANPITVTSYGTGRATISSGTKHGMTVNDAGGYVITDLIFRGPGMFVGSKSGIYITTSLSTATTFEHFYIDNVEASDYGGTGIWFAAPIQSSLRDITVTNCELHHNQVAGLEIIGPAGAEVGFGRRIFDVYIGHVNASYNAGIFLGSVDGAVVERCLSYGTAAGSVAPVAFWAYSSSNVVFQHNEAWGCVFPGRDGGGFMFDYDTRNCTMQYNYSHNNAGPGFFMCAGPPVKPELPDSSGNVIRYNVSENDCRLNDYGAISVYCKVDNSQIYNNTVFISPRAGGANYAALQVWAWSDAKNLQIYNNIFMTTNGVWLIQIYKTILPSNRLVLAGNNYYASGSTFKLLYDGTTYNSLSQLQNATGQEKFNNRRVGSVANPQLNNPGAGGTIGDADALSGLTAYMLKSTSPLKNSGLNLPMFYGIQPGPKDFYGNAIPGGAGYSVGAHDPS
jgi:hypothetical protein